MVMRRAMPKIMDLQNITFPDSHTPGFVVSLRLKHPTLELGSLCKTMGMKPNILWSAGEPRRTPKGLYLGGVRDNSYANCRINPVNKSSPDKLIEHALLSMTSNKVIYREFIDSGGTSEFYVAIFSEEGMAFLINTQLVDMLAELRCAVGFELFRD